MRMWSTVDWFIAVALQARHKVLEDVAVAETAVARQHHLQEYVLRHQHRIQVAVFDQLANRNGVLLVARRLRLLVGVEVVHANHIVFDEGAAIGKAALILVVVEARIHVAEHGMPQVGALALDHVEHAMGKALPARQVDRQRQHR